MKFFNPKPYKITLRKEYDNWGPVDSEALNLFVHNNTGRKLIYRFEKAIHNMALEPKRATDFHDGIRVGQALLLEQIAILSQLPDSVETEDSYRLNSDEKS